ncbi:hypothetical protein IG193_03890 [Infirmifilum lucidum]|uniref:Uncharacterized protein n=1 Tax=Infirmifilum lucidum TaxID=2776706 RepID=A0A7L9FIE8_9CREN|nr:hypothetical protein [Infirmifilum lucidum]QOJ79608.1 hypothetical protein IG193_03890 [Infirmifilum lucidum]
MSLRNVLRPFGKPGVHVVYGRPQSFKTSFSTNVALSVSKSKVLYVGLAKHSVVHPEPSEKLEVMALPNLKRELHFLLSLELIPGDVDVMVYDGFSAYFLPLRFYMRESAVVKLQLLAASRLYSLSRLRSIPILVTAQEVSQGRPLAYRVLRVYAHGFTRLERTDPVLRVQLQNRDLEVRASYLVPLEELWPEKENKQAK